MSDTIWDNKRMVLCSPIWTLYITYEEKTRDWSANASQMLGSCQPVLNKIISKKNYFCSNLAEGTIAAPFILMKKQSNDEEKGSVAFHFLAILLQSKGFLGLRCAICRCIDFLFLRGISDESTRGIFYCCIFPITFAQATSRWIALKGFIWSQKIVT